MAEQPGGSLSWTDLDPADIGRHIRPRFPTVFERKFLRDRIKDPDHNSLGLLFIGLVLFNLGPIGDNVIVHGILARSILIHLTFYTPIGFACMLTLKYATSHIQQEIAKFVLTFSASITSFFVFWQVANVPAVVLASRSIIIVTFGALILRQSLKSILLTNLLIAFAQVIFFHICHGVSKENIPVCMSITIAGMSVALLGSLKVERTERVAYLLLRQSEANAAQLRRANMELAEISHSDGLTGLSNRRHFNTFSETLWKERRERRDERFPVSVIMVDIDHFKRLNDTHGHLAGDEVLIEVAKILKEWVRTGEDIVARFGGEEFVLMLPGIETGDAVEVAERIVEAVRHQPLVLQGKDEPVHVTISCGVSTARHPVENSVEQLLATADAALYESKRTGRDRVRWHAPLHTALS